MSLEYIDSILDQCFRVICMRVQKHYGCNFTGISRSVVVSVFEYIAVDPMGCVAIEVNVTSHAIFSPLSSGTSFIH